MFVNRLLVILTITSTFATNKVYSQQDVSCSRPEHGCMSASSAENCLKWNGCVWNAIGVDGLGCISSQNCEGALPEAIDLVVEVDDEKRKPKNTKTPTEYPTFSVAPTTSPTKYPSVIETIPPTGSPVPGMCKFPIVTCPNLNDASNCVAFSGCFWNNIIKKCANKPECSRTSFPTRRPTEASDCATPIGSTCTAVTRDGLCNSYSGCIWVVGTGCINKPECSKTAFPTPVGGTNSPTSKPIGAITASPTAITASPTAITKSPTGKGTSYPTELLTPAPTMPTRSPFRITTPTSRSPTIKPTTTRPASNSPTVFPTNQSITSAPSYTPTKAFTEQDCSRFAGSKATCLLIVYCKWCPSCSRPTRCQHV